MWSFTYKKPEEIVRMQTMAKLGENVLQIEMQIAECDLMLHNYEKTAKASLLSSRTDDQLRIYFQRIQQVNIQREALRKSRRALETTASSLDSQNNLQKIKNVLSYTLETHQMSKELGFAEEGSEKLLEDFEHISQTIENERMLLEGIDLHVSDLSESSNVNEVLSKQEDQFLKWKKSISATSQENDLQSSTVKTKHRNGSNAMLA